MSRTSVYQWTGQIAALMLMMVVGAVDNVFGQSTDGRVEGSISDADGRRLVSVVLRLEGTQLGALSTEEGTFLISDVPPGTYELTATLVGFRKESRNITVKPGQTTRVTLEMEGVTLQGGEVVVQANRKRQAQSDTRTSVVSVKPREAKYLPGAAEDVMRSLRSLPGVLAPNDFSAQLVVRGSGPDQNLILMDGVEVFNPYRLYGVVSMFNPETLSDITLLSGGFPAKYGDRLSAVLDVTNRTGERSNAPITGKLNTSLTNANLVLEGSIPGLNGGWLLSTRRTYYDLILGPVLKSLNVFDGDVALPNFRDLQFKGSITPFEGNTFSINALTSRDGTDLTSSEDRERLDSISVSDESYNSLVGLAWQSTPMPNLVTNTMVNWYQNEGDTEFGGQGGSRFLYGDVSRDSLAAMIQRLPPEIQDSLRSRGIDPENPPVFSINGDGGFTFRKYTLRNESSLDLGTNLIEFGAGVDFIRTALEFEIERDSLFEMLIALQGRSTVSGLNSDVEYYRAHAYAQDRLNFSDRFYLQFGTRFDYYQLIDKAYISPRISASYAVDDLTTLRGAYGIYYQSPGYEKLVDSRRPIDFTSPEVRDLGAEESTHYILGVERMLDAEWQVKGEVYYKDFSDLIDRRRLTGTRWVSQPIPGENPRYASSWTTPVPVTTDSVTQVPENIGTGEAYGVEFMLQKINASTDSKLTGWISYALAWAERFDDGYLIPFNFDQRHTVNLVMNYQANDWLELGASFQLGSGFPYTPAVGFYPLVVMNTDSLGNQTPAVASNLFGEALFRVDYGGEDNDNSARLPLYHRLDVRATVYADWWDFDWAFYLDVINVYNKQNLLRRSYSVDSESITLESREVYMLPILPTLGMSVRF